MFIDTTHDVFVTEQMSVETMFIQLLHPSSEYLVSPDLLFGYLPISGSGTIDVRREPFYVQRIVENNPTNYSVQIHKDRGPVPVSVEKIIPRVTGCLGVDGEGLCATKTVKIYRPGNEESYTRERVTMELLKTLLEPFIGVTIPELIDYDDSSQQLIYSSVYDNSLPLIPWTMKMNENEYRRLVATLFLFVLETLRKLHERGIVHGNVTPESIQQESRGFSDPDEKIVCGVLTGWGYARLVGEDHLATFRPSEFLLTNKTYSESIGEQLLEGADEVKFGFQDDLAAFVLSFFSCSGALHKSTMRFQEGVCMFTEMEAIKECLVYSHSCFRFADLLDAAANLDYDTIRKIIVIYGGETYMFPTVRGENIPQLLTCS
jgi:hypothetical protein